MNDMNTELLTDITELGNALVLFGLSLSLSIYFWVLGYRREPLALMLSFFAPSAIIGVLKIAFYICHTNFFGIVSPSGHAAISISVMGLSALILAKICAGVWRAVIPILLVVLSLVIAISRSILGMHTDGDVMIGSLIGFCIVIAVAKTVLSYRIKTELGNNNREIAQKKKVNPVMICLLIIGVAVVFYGIRLPSEKVMASFAKEIRFNLALCN